MWGEGDGPTGEFKPTYKMKANKNGEYENVKDECPSYTDRILLKKNASDEITGGDYRSLTTIRGSNHVPVALNFAIKDFFAVNTAYLDQITMTSPIPSSTVTIDEVSLKLDHECLHNLELLGKEG